MMKSFHREPVYIDISIKDISYVFNKFHYIGFGEKQLNKDLEEYIIREININKLSKDIVIKFSILQKLSSKEKADIKQLVQEHFKLRALETKNFLEEQIYKWEINMIIGTLFLILCLLSVEILDKFSHIYILNILKESLLIIGWVALWEPINFMLFGWQNIKKDINLYNNLANAVIIVS